ncbi:MAG: hypothetical protein EOR54_23590 [Mesorhizobium sp.]|nr:MAG: hypothetical protein EOR54_23590 [Mesorhizobium sp.]
MSTRPSSRNSRKPADEIVADPIDRRRHGIKGVHRRLSRAMALADGIIKESQRRLQDLVAGVRPPCRGGEASKAPRGC